MILEVSCGNHRQLIHTESCALNLVTILVVLHSHTVIFPSASPDTTRLEGGGEREVEREREKMRRCLYYKMFSYCFLNDSCKGDAIP